MLLCTLATYLVWHLRQAWAPLTFTDEHRPEPADPVAPASRSAAARSFTGLLDHLATLTRNEIRFLAVENQPIIDQLAVPTPLNAEPTNFCTKPFH